VPPTKVAIRSAGNLSGAKLTVDFIDVGQGNAVLVSYPNGEFMLVDCGSQATSLTGTPYKHAEAYVNSVCGTTDIKCVVMSHGDDDHCAFIPDITRAQNPTLVHYGGKIGEYSDALQKWINQWENSKTRKVFRYPDSYCDVNPDADFGSETYADQAQTSVLSASFGDDPNSRSIVLMVRFGNQAVILPGDGDISTEAFIIKKVPKALLGKCTVLMPGHHGALESTGDNWVKALQPQIDAISASGTNMSYAHPACLTIEILKPYALGGAEEHNIICSDGKGKKYTTSKTKNALFVTSTNGDIRYQTDGKNWRVLVSSYAIPVPEVVVRGPLWEQFARNGPWARAREQRPARRVGPVRPALTYASADGRRSAGREAAHGARTSGPHPHPRGHRV